MIYILTITAISNGEFDYSTPYVFTDKETAKKFAANRVKAQSSIWGTRPVVKNKIKGFATNVQLTNKAGDYFFNYQLREVNEFK